MYTQLRRDRTAFMQTNKIMTMCTGTYLLPHCMREADTTLHVTHQLPSAQFGAARSPGPDTTPAINTYRETRNTCDDRESVRSDYENSENTGQSKPIEVNAPLHEPPCHPARVTQEILDYAHYLSISVTVRVNKTN